MNHNGILYGSPPGFDFDQTSDDPPFLVDEKSRDYNAPERAKLLMQHIDDKAKNYLTDHLFLVFGADFEYQNAFKNYESMDNMIEYMNKNHGDKYFFRYSTPSEYIDALAEEKVAWPTKEDDLFPYAGEEHGYWTGFYTSRANSKEYVRRASHNLHASSQLFALKALDQSTSNEMMEAIMKANYNLLDQMGINQHHDAVTGTARQAVADDYAKRLYDGMEQSNTYYGNLTAEKIKQETGFQSKSGWLQCSRTNSTYMDCPIEMVHSIFPMNYTMNVAMHNPSSLPMKSARMAVPHGHYDVKVFNKTSQAFEEAVASVNCYKDRRTDGKPIESCFLHVDVEVAPFEVSLIQVKADKKQDLKVPSKPIELGDLIENDDVEFSFAGYDKSKSLLRFNVLDKKLGADGKAEVLEFSMKYWQAYTNFDDPGRWGFLEAGD